MYKIVGTYKGSTEVIEENIEEYTKGLEYLGEYRMAFGKEWHLSLIEE